MSQSVELRPAFAWDCPNCGRSYYANMVVPDIDPAERKRLNEQGIKDVEINALLVERADMPVKVKCNACGQGFRTHPYGAEAAETTETNETE